MKKRLQLFLSIEDIQIIKIKAIKKNMTASDYIVYLAKKDNEKS